MLLNQLIKGLLVLTAITVSYAGYVKTYRQPLPRLPTDSNNGEFEPQSFKRLIEYYRSEVSRNPGFGLSIETDSEESRSNSKQPKPHLYKIDLSNGDDEDESPYADEMVPIASYIHDENKNKPTTEATTAVPTIATSTSTVNSVMEVEMKNMSMPNSGEVQVQVDSTTIMVPTDPMTPMMVDKQIKTSKVDTADVTDDIIAPPMKENEEDDDEDEDSEERCDEGQTKKQKCNMCVCVDGAFFCSKKKCETKPGMNEQVDQHMMDKINSTLNKKGWYNRKKPVALADCSSGMSKSVDCNQCICAQGKWACTKRSCIALTFREKASYTDGSVVKQVDTLKENHDLDEDCVEGNTRQLDCNQCVCHYNSWSCTSLPCAPTPAPPRPDDIEEACQREADVKNKDCNLCKCTRGVWVCTRNDCKIGDNVAHASPPLSRSSSKITKASK